MKVVIIDCATAGASGDKILAAVVNAGGSDLRLKMEKVVAKIVREGTFYFEEAESEGMKGLRVVCDYRGKRYEGDLLGAVKAASSHIGLSRRGKEVAARAASLILEAEREVHGDGALHELGEIDSVVDIVGTVKALEELDLGGAEFFTTPLRVGEGWIKSGHGILPIPAPATLNIAVKAGLSIVVSPVDHELTTPTGAAILAALTGGNSSPPVFRPRVIGIGIGSHKLDVPNITRIIVGEAKDEGDRVIVVESNIDDVSGEVLGWLVERLKGMTEDVFFTPIFMKKCRPGFTVRVVVKPKFKEDVVNVIMRELGTLGVKVFECERIKADREVTEEWVKIGEREYKVRVKRSRSASRLKPEFEDLRQIAVGEGKTLREVMEEVIRQVRQK